MRGLRAWEPCAACGVDDRFCANIAVFVARLLAPGPNNPAGFILTTLVGIAGAFVATFIGQAIGWYGSDQGAGLIGAVIGALVVLFIWHRLVSARAIPDPGARRWL